MTDSKLLATVVIGVVLERLDLKRLTLQYRNEIWKRIFEEGCSFDEVVEEVHKKLSSQGTQVTTMQAGNIYNDIPAAMENYKAFLSSESLAEARSSLQEVRFDQTERFSFSPLIRSRETGTTSKP